MTILLIALHVIVCVFLIFVVLLQSAQAADLAGAFGGGGSQTALGMRGATTMLHKATTVAALLFMVTSLALGLIGRNETSVIQGLQEPNTPAPMSPDQAGQEQEQQGAQSDDGSQDQSGPAGQQDQEQADGTGGDQQQEEAPAGGDASRQDGSAR